MRKIRTVRYRTAVQRWRLYHAMRQGLKVYWIEERPHGVWPNGERVGRILKATSDGVSAGELMRTSAGEMKMTPKGAHWYETKTATTDRPLGSTHRLTDLTAPVGRRKWSAATVRRVKEYKALPKEMGVGLEFLRGFNDAWNGRTPKPVEHPYHTGYRVAVDIIRGYHEPLDRPTTPPKVSAATASLLVQQLPVVQVPQSHTGLGTAPDDSRDAGDPAGFGSEDPAALGDGGGGHGEGLGSAGDGD